MREKRCDPGGSGRALNQPQNGVSAVPSSALFPIYLSCVSFYCASDRLIMALEKDAGGCICQGSFVYFAVIALIGSDIRLNVAEMLPGTQIE